MTEIDYSKYSIEELRSVLTGIDRSKYPEKVKIVEDYLEDLLADPDVVLESKAENDFFKSHVPSEIVTSVWLRMIGWSLVTTFAVGFPLAFALALIFNMLKIEQANIQLTIQVFIWVISLGASWLFLRRILGTAAGSYEIVFRRKES